ncbi:MAG TPA: MotA/TolQ/ExbB proton channel family protein [Candidatus Manganitrophaceae bacterium]|nr:MotA/TolQ/ExbB proton channel family protein [Candidatus Manganitrophaceae bacterium]
MEIVGLLTGLLKEGGVFIYLILLVLFLGMAIVIERGLFLSRAKINGGALLLSIREALQANNIEGAIAACHGAPSPLSHIFLKGLGRVSSPVQKEALQGAVDEALLEILPKVEKRIDYLPTLANIANLLGLLGTIMGLIKSFQAISVADPAQKAALLAQGISTAMYATAFGLMVAIPLMFCYSVLQSKTNQILDHLEEFTLKFVNAVCEKR